jgi:hypothetical protein
MTSDPRLTVEPRRFECDRYDWFWFNALLWLATAAGVGIALLALTLREH